MVLAERAAEHLKRGERFGMQSFAAPAGKALRFPDRFDLGLFAMSETERSFAHMQGGKMRSQLFELRARPTMQRALPHLRDGSDVK